MKNPAFYRNCDYTEESASHSELILDVQSVGHA